jgi:hypothetical protein
MSQSQGKTARRSTKSTATSIASTATATDQNSEFANMQSAMGNAAVASMLAQQGSETTSERTRFSALERATLLASSERMALAQMVFSESTPSVELTDEMRALAAVGQNQLDHMEENPQDQGLFGTNDIVDVLQDPFQYEEYGQSSQKVFNDAARFNAEFDSEQDLQHALRAIEAATEIENAGNPFNDDFLVFSADEEIPHADRIDETSKTTFGALTFWAFTSGTTKKFEEEETSSTLHDLGGEAEPT